MRKLLFTALILLGQLLILSGNFSASITAAASDRQNFVTSTSPEVTGSPYARDLLNFGDRLINFFTGEQAPAATPAVTTPASTATPAPTPDPQQAIPHGWPVKGPVTSPFGLRPSIAEEVSKAKGTLTPQGGNPPATPADTATPAPAGQPATPTPTISATPANSASIAKTTPAAKSGTPSPAVTQAPNPPANTSPAPSPTATPAPTSTPAPTPTSTPTPTATATPTQTPTPTPAEEFHTGIDIAVPEGTPVHATADGVVEYAGDGRGGYGNVVFIDHAGGYTTIYGHNSRLLVKPGQVVHTGDVIALSGSTGYSTGPHVHYEIRYNGQAIDPWPFMQ
ncbi:MAG TPA: peptidoglycan DD-metalloendopeptidase family protein [Chloroflexia bacterium]|nr:peptidoglycan DD-metalloendopeptidase family protein [Chloroflexia bacterium]